jgi:hypothetical protein
MCFSSCTFCSFSSKSKVNIFIYVGRIYIFIVNGERNIIFYLYLENEYIYLDEQYYEVINIVHVINENKIFFIIIDEVVKKEVP